MAIDLSTRILIVDDYNTMIRIIRNLLKQLGFENVDEASDGSSMLSAALRRNFTGVLPGGLRAGRSARGGSRNLR